MITDLHKSNAPLRLYLTSIHPHFFFEQETYTIGSLQFRGAAGIVTQNKAQLPPKVDGIMGLWYYAAGSAVPILNVLRNNTLLPRNMIGIWLQSTTPNGRSSGSGKLPGASAGGEITFGGVDTTKFQGEITYVNCEGKRPWSVSVLSLVGPVSVLWWLSLWTVGR